LEEAEFALEIIQVPFSFHYFYFEGVFLIFLIIKIGGAVVAAFGVDIVEPGIKLGVEFDVDSLVDFVVQKREL
jgi:hypothetical protein